MTTLLAQRLKLAPEEIDMLRAGDPSAVIARQVRDPSLAAAFTSMLRKPNEEERRPGPTTQEQLQQAVEQIRQLRQDLAAADAMLKYIADVFGTCPACWGQNQQCVRCGGRGQPGSRVPLEEELLAWVRPAFRRLHLQVVRAPV